MSKKQKRKRKQKKQKKKPDEVYASGPMRLERYGRFVLMQNRATEEQNEQFKKNAKAQYPEICNEIDERIASIRRLIGQLDPLRLLQAGFFRFAKSVLGKTAEQDARRRTRPPLFLIIFEGLIYKSPVKTE